jgi:hypothetical protein
LNRIFINHVYSTPANDHLLPRQTAAEFQQKLRPAHPQPARVAGQLGTRFLSAPKNPKQLTRLHAIFKELKSNIKWHPVEIGQCPQDSLTKT